VSDYIRTREQEDVIGHSLEPLRVAAGAGTGKTATVTDRLVSLIEAGIPPEAALGVTFTNKAAEELADRLRSALADHARNGREVEVTTYHGFAYALLQEFGALVGVERDAQVIGPGYQRQLLFESLTGGEYRHLDMSAPSARVAEAVTLSSQLGDNLRVPDELLTQEFAGLDDPWPARSELAGIARRYEELKRRLGVVDYSDLIRYAHRLVTDFPHVTDRVRARYRCVVLDEYQDTAPAQRELLRVLFSDGFPITAVGDSDQTIYEWRGASQENFDAFPVHFPTPAGREAETLPLSVNHRSGSRILEVAHDVRAMIHASGEFRRLSPDESAPEGSVEARWFRTAVDEAAWLAAEITRLHVEDDVPWRDIAVLFRKNRQIGLVRDACSLAGIPIEVASLGGLLDVPEVADLVAWLRLLHHRDDTVSLARILLGSRYRLGLGDIAALVRWARQQGLWREDDGGPSWPLLEAVDRIEEIEDLADEPRSRLEEFRDLYRSLLTQAQGLALVELCRRILDAFDAWAEVEAMESSAALSARLNLYRFLDLAQEWSPLEGRPSLEAFLGYLELLQSDPSTDELDTARVGGSDAVVLLTVHRAKGLEWDTVFLPALADGIFPSRSLGHDNPAQHARYLPFDLRLDAASLPDLNVPKPERDEALRQRHLAGEWRTAYVATTRAQERLYLSGAYWYGGVRPKQPSQLFELAAANRAATVIEGPAEPGERPERLAMADAGAGPDPLFAEGWQEALRHTLEDPGWPLALVDDTKTYDGRVDQLRMLVDGLAPDLAVPDPERARLMSVTGLVTLAGCPLRYYWSDVDPLPRRPSPAMQRGVEVHRKIELHNRGAISFDDLEDDLYDAPAGAETRTPSERAPFEVFLASRFAERTPRFIETAIDLQVGKARVRGRIDAVYEDDDGSWEIVDYKSGAHRGDEAAFVQLEAYAVAARDGAIAPESPESLKVTFLYLGGPEPQEVGMEADAVWLESASAHLADLVASAAGDEFPATPSPSCSHCDFVKFCEQGRAYLDDT
jgi:DNA helicase-2/ATP-dependent DNA helicase PcrA